MGHTHSQDAFAAVLPADKTAQSGNSKPTKSVSSGAAAAGTPLAKAPGPKTLAANGEQNDSAVVLKELLSSASAMRIQPPAHALLLHDDPRVSTARTSSCGGDDCALTHRERDDGDSDTATTDSRFLVPESVRKSRTLDEFADVCSEILPNFLFVSNLQVASNSQKLKEIGITYIVNCCKELESCSPLTTNLSDTKVLSLALRDDTKEDLLWFFYQAIEFIQSAEAAVAHTNKVLVHCHQGISRSCALVVAYVMYQQQQQQSPASFCDAMAFVKAKRSIASPNTAFLCQLIEWERELAAFSSDSSPHSTDTGLYRLAPHAAHDPNTLVLKCCYKPESQRQKLVLENGFYSPWLFARGVFVFMRLSISRSREIVIWRGRNCEIPDGVAKAKALVEQMVRVRLAQRSSGEGKGDLTHLGVEIVEAREEDQEIGGGDSLMDHFGYAEELDWLKIRHTSSGSSIVDPANSAAPSSSTSTSAQKLHAEAAAATIAESVSTNSPPLLFILKDVNDEEVAGGVWDQLTEYDSEDLTPRDAFLLIQPSKDRHFLWIGSDYCTVFAPETLVKCAQKHVRTLLCGGEGSSTNGAPRGEDGGGAPTFSIKMEKGGDESDAFWTAFESGY